MQKNKGTAAFDLADHLPEKDVLTACQALFACKCKGVEVTHLERLNNSSLESRFTKTLRQNPSLKVKMVFYGTDFSNHESIKKTGLCVPSRSTGIQTANGAARRRGGIYTSECPIYSLPDCGKEPKMFVCAVLTGSKHVSKNSVFYFVKKDAYVLPLYLLTFKGYKVPSSTRRPMPDVTSFQYYRTAALGIGCTVMVLIALCCFIGLCLSVCLHENRMEPIYFVLSAGIRAVDVVATFAGSTVLYLICLGFDTLVATLSKVSSLC